MTNDMLSSYLRAWARHRVFIALSSHEAAARSGLTCGEAARLFGALCLEAPPAGERFPPPPARTASQARSLPAECAVDLVVRDTSLIYRFSYGHPEPVRRGEVNAGFLSPDGLGGRLLPLLDALGERLRLVILRPAPLYRTEALPFGHLLERLDGFLAALPGPCRYALEPASPAVLRPEYFACLRAHGVLHVFDEGDPLFRMMPPLAEQLAAPGGFALPEAGSETGLVCVVRSTACAGLPGVPWPQPGLRRQGWCDAVRRCLAAGVPLHLFVDDEHDPLRSLGVLMAMLNTDLARQSVLRRRAA
jgi:hypothetical protein